MEEDGQSANKRARLGSESDNVAECTKELFRLVNKSDNQGLKKLIDKTDASILQQSLEGYMEEDYKEWTPLLAAAYNGSSDIISTLLAAGADVYAQDVHDRTALFLTADQEFTTQSRDKCAELLLQHAQMQRRSGLACILHHIKVRRRVLDAQWRDRKHVPNQNVCSPDGTGKRAASAAGHMHTNTESCCGGFGGAGHEGRSLKRTDGEVSGSSLATALHLMSTLSDDLIRKILTMAAPGPAPLVHVPARIASRTLGITPLMQASDIHWLEGVELFLRRGAYAFARNSDGECALDYADSETLGEILESWTPALRICPSSDPCRRLLQAVKREVGDEASHHLGCVRAILRGAGGWDRTDGKALHIASLKGNINVVHSLLRAKACPHKALQTLRQNEGTLGRPNVASNKVIEMLSAASAAPCTPSSCTPSL
eukprot:INCI14.1.p1 GENE.INCI14.1~~INCI14.1.p1  ORF type:complete len:429 (-),score=61.20 INCI14.1:147-1433(-)